jgi:hypothetical protein
MALGAPSELGPMHIGTPSATTGTSLKDRDNGCHMHGDMDVTRLRCLHITLIVFGCIHVIIGIFSVQYLNIVGMLFGFVAGILGIASGSVITRASCALTLRAGLSNGPPLSCPSSTAFSTSPLLASRPRRDGQRKTGRREEMGPTHRPYSTTPRNGNPVNGNHLDQSLSSPQKNGN